MTETVPDTVLECRNLSRRFDVGGMWRGQARSLRAVDDVSVSVRRGEILAIVGESGCGKTTMSRMVLGLLEPTDGSIVIEGQPLAEIDRMRMSRSLQPVFQDPYSSLNPRHTVAQIIGMPLDVHRIGTSAERKARVRDMMKEVGLPGRFAHTYPGQLSGGQRQRVAIARALAVNPRILICDEPTSALDVSVQAQILNLLLDLRERLGLTYIFISHDLSVVQFVADRVAVMYMGRIVEAGETAEVTRRPRHPYTQALMRAVLTPEPGLGLPDLQLQAGFADPFNPPPGCHFHPRCAQAMERCRVEAPIRLHDDHGDVECHLYGNGGQRKL
ncbi:MAG TPA: oligopeptide/dipeptide ABC transporter ATP-binding protein [Xanthobacteraceae bacterium]|nr:oligopeptide/dipeptide ABC transporter ATP-binding protein [Xanthobacteraceae bacterium]